MKWTVSLATGVLSLMTVSAFAISTTTATTQMDMKNATPAEMNLAQGQKFLNANKTRQGVVTTKSGLQYKIIKKGAGPVPTLIDKVTVNYEGKLLNGKVFDSSYARKKPITFPVNGVIQGWQEALTKMHQGATWMLYIPAKLAYGANGAGGVIGPNETLIFKVQLLKVNA